MTAPPLTEEQTKRLTKALLMVLQSKHQGEVATAARWIARFIDERGTDVYEFAGRFARELQRQSAAAGPFAAFTAGAYAPKPKRPFYHENSRADLMVKLNGVFALRFLMSELDRQFLQAMRQKLITGIDAHPEEERRIMALWTHYTELAQGGA